MSKNFNSSGTRFIIPEKHPTNRHPKPLEVMLTGCGCFEVMSHHQERCGYSQVKRNKTILMAHRWVYQEYIEDIPDGMLVLHRCDNRVCVSPAHLYLGSHAQNANDMRTKGRSNCLGGASSPHAKLTQSDVDSIRLFYYSGFKTKAELSRIYKVTKTNIGHIIAERSWRI